MASDTKQQATAKQSGTPPPPPRAAALSTTTLLSISLLVTALSTIITLFIQSYIHSGHFLSTRHSYPSASGSEDWFDADGKFSTDKYRATHVCRDAYKVKVLNRDPMVLFVENFLLPGEAEYVRAISAERMKRSSVAASTDDYYSVSNVRTSSSAFLEKGEDEVVSCIERRGSELSQVPTENCEPLQVVWYTEGQQYQPHYDYFPREHLVDHWSNKAGQRYVTILVYLNDEGLVGGATEFPRLNMTVAPKKSGAVMWYNVGIDEEEDPRTMHGGMPVQGGEKWAINMWQRKKIPGWDSGKSLPGKHT